MNGDHEAPALAPGQVWRFLDPPADEARLIVGAISEVGENVVAHVAIFNLPPPPDSDDTATPAAIGHLPFALDALADSVVALEGEFDPPEELIEASRQWEAEAATGEAMIIALPVGKTLKLIYDETAKAETH